MVVAGCACVCWQCSNPGPSVLGPLSRAPACDLASFLRAAMRNCVCGCWEGGRVSLHSVPCPSWLVITFHKCTLPASLPCLCFAPWSVPVSLGSFVSLLSLTPHCLAGDGLFCSFPRYLLSPMAFGQEVSGSILLDEHPGCLPRQPLLPGLGAVACLTLTPDPPQAPHAR